MSPANWYLRSEVSITTQAAYSPLYFPPLAPSSDLILVGINDELWGTSFGYL